MLFQTEKVTAETFGTQETTRVKISDSAKMFRIIIDRLYSDVTRAAIRELWSNAFDSHIAAGTPDKPFDVQLPNYFDPSFVVRDYGVSMTHDVVMNLYSTVGDSSKDDSDTEVGMFGLGSKSPWAYVDVFTVECFLDGEHRLYSAYIAEDGRPSIDLLARQKTTEPNGVKVSFPVEPDDIPDFNRKAKMVARGFEVRPNVTGVDGFYDELDQLKVVIEGIGWKVMERVYGIDTLFQVRQGCVIYPVDFEQFNTHFSYDSVERGLFQMNVIVDMPIGSVDITPSREHLKYDPKTIANIAQRVRDIAHEIVKKIEERISEAKTFAEAIAIKEEVLGSSSIFNGHAFRAMKWRGRKLTGRTVSCYERGRKTPTKVRSMYMSSSDFVHGRTYRSNGFSGRFEMNDDLFNPNKVYYFLEDTTGDRVKHSGLRVKEKFRSIIAAMSNTDLSPAGFVWIKGDLKSRDFQRLLVSVGRPSEGRFINVADLPEPIKTTVHASKRSPVKCKLYNRDTNRWDEGMVNSDDDNVIYVAKVRNDYVDLPGNPGNDSVADICKVLIENGAIDNDKVIAVIPATHKKLIEKNEGLWANLVNIFNEFLDGVDIAKAAYKEHFDSIVLTHAFSRPIGAFASTLAKDGLVPTARSDLREMVARMRVLYRLSRRAVPSSEVEALYMKYRSDEFYKKREAEQKSAYAIITANEAKDLSKEISKQYPLIEHCVASYARDVHSTLRDHLLSYVEMVDKNNAA